MRRHLASGLRRHVPVPVQGASTSTRSKLLGMAPHPFVARALERPALDDAGAGAAQPLGRALEPMRGDVAGDEMPAIAHGRGERQGLAAGAGAEIDDAHARPRIDQQRRELRALVLHLDLAAFERVEDRERDALEDAQPSGENGVRAASTPSRASAARAASRSLFSRLTRRSSGAVSAAAAISRPTSRPSAAAKCGASHAG